jgi:putative membrane protein insertion efficiency factor
MSVSRETPAPADHPVSRETVACGHAHARIRAASPLAAALLLPIRAYRRFLSPALNTRCRYYPSCSAYAEEAIRDLGAFRGTILAAWRLLRCNPFSSGGMDPVSERPIFGDRRLREGAKTA